MHAVVWWALVVLIAVAVTVDAVGQQCPPLALVEPETCGVDISGGCSSTPPTAIAAACGDVWCGTAWADGGIRDVDWYTLDLPDPDGDGVQGINVKLTSRFPGVVFIVDGYAECNPVIVAAGCADQGVSIMEASAVLPAPDTIAVFVAAGTCKGDGIFDDIPCGSQNDYTVKIECVAVCPADVNGDGSVDTADLLQLLAHWGPCAGCSADLDGDGHVDTTDLLAVLADWGPCP